MIVSLWWQVAAIVAPCRQDLKAVLTYWQGPGNLRPKPPEVSGTGLVTYVRYALPATFDPAAALLLRHGTIRVDACPGLAGLG